MIELIYASSATIHFDHAELVRLLQKARERNTALSVTGMLLYEAGSFLQVIEGEERAIELLYQRIAIDSRHKRLMKLSQSPIAKRNFGEWSMGFADVGGNAHDVNPIMARGFSPAVFLRGESPSKAKEVLMAFREGRFRTHVDSDLSLVEKASTHHTRA
jgi:hypothetical protein